MEQRHSAAKSHWYHETQSSLCSADNGALVPEAAQVAHRFLLDCPLPDEPGTTHNDWLLPAHRMALLLFPETISVTRMNTLSSYDRLSTALTVAQVCGVQRLCNHYAARLAPLSGPDSSRESNLRLTLITQFARQLASQPTQVNASAMEQLQDAGLSPLDIITFIHIIGFVGFQARVIAAIQALHGQQPRRLPGMEIQSWAAADIFTDPPASAEIMHSYLTPGQSNEQQRKAVDSISHLPQLTEIRWLLAQNDELLLQLATLFQRMPRPTDPQPEYQQLINQISARINGCRIGFTVAQNPNQPHNTLTGPLVHGERAFLAWSHQQPVLKSVTDIICLIIRAPGFVGADQLIPLTEQDFTRDQQLHILVKTALAGWLDRLNIALRYRSET